LAAFSALVGALGAANLVAFLPPLVGLAILALAIVAGALSKQIMGTGLPHGVGWFGAALAGLGALDAALIVPPGCVPSPAEACEAVRLLTLFPPKVGAVLVVVGVVLKAFARGQGDVVSKPGG
jgi:uncharacterized membrane protein YeaQ/YmgE (transglycosylase-associated protein family)